MSYKARLCFLWRLAAQLHRSCPLPCSSINYLKVRQLDFFSSKNIKPEFIFVLLLVAKHFSSGCKGLSKAFSLREKVTSFLKKIKSVLQNRDFPSIVALPLGPLFSYLQNWAIAVAIFISL